ncbi:MAG TPA: hypothetical protein VKM54_15595, partial [Myxococcota bacterium]|nr:hypothetical protein [Myxococcota bacterium]
VVPPPRKTRFRPLARRYRAGLATRWVPAEGFDHVIVRTSLTKFPSAHKITKEKEATAEMGG